MSFQAYLDNIEEKTGLTPRQFIELANGRGFGQSTKATPIIEWLKADYDLGRGHAMALVHVITKGAAIDAKHVGNTGVHRDESDTLWLDGRATRPASDLGASSRSMIGPMGDDDLRSMITGFRVSMALSATADFGLSDELAGGPRTVADLAVAVSADEDTLHRLLRALATVGVYDERPDGTWNASLGEGLRSDVPGSLRPLARTLQDPAMWAAWGSLGDSVRTGQNAFEALHGVDVWTHRQGHPEHNAIFNDNMTAELVRGRRGRLGVRLRGPDQRGRRGRRQGHPAGRRPRRSRTPHRHGVRPRPRRGDGADVRRFVRTMGGGDREFLRVGAGGGCLPPQVDPARLAGRPLRRDPAHLRSVPQPRAGVVLVSWRRFSAGRRLRVEVPRLAFSDLNMLVMRGGRERSEKEYAALFHAAGLRLTLRRQRRSSSGSGSTTPWVADTQWRWSTSSPRARPSTPNTSAPPAYTATSPTPFWLDGKASRP